MAELRKYEKADFLAVELARKYSEEYGEPFLVAVGKHADWDYMSVSGKIIGECKSEESSQRTNNAFLEYWNTELNAPSGVLSTKSNLWTHFLLTSTGWIVVEYEIDTLRKLVIEKGQIKSNGRNSLGKIISLEEYKKHAKRVYVFESRFLNNTIVPQEGNLGHGEIPESGNVPCRNLSDVA